MRIAILKCITYNMKIASNKDNEIIVAESSKNQRSVRYSEK